MQRYEIILIYANIYFINNLEMDKSQYRLLSANEIDKFDGYDKVVAQTHIANVGCIIVDSTYGDPIDNEYDLEEIYQAIESTKMYESKNRKNIGKNTIKLTESEFKKIIAESVKKVLKENQEFYVCGETVYGEGDNYWIGDKNDSEYCKNSSEGFSKGPFRTEEEALAWANKNGININDNSDKNTQNNRGLDANEQIILKNVQSAINAIDVVLNDIEKGDDFVNGIDESYQSVHDARVLMTSVKYALMGQGQEATNILFRNFGDEMAMRYLQF